MLKILIIDDDNIFREGIAEWLTLEGYEIIEAETGVDGINGALEARPDIVICDLVMPDMDGYAILEKFQADPALQVIPFIFLSARANLADIRRAMELGADDYLTKPFTCPALLAAIDMRVKKRANRAHGEQSRIASLEQALTDEKEERQLRMRLAEIFVQDFRTPLLQIASGASTLRNFADRLTDDQRRTRLTYLEGSARLLLQMLDDIRDIAEMDKVNGNISHAVIENTDVAELVGTVCNEFRSIMTDGHRLQFSGPQSVIIPTDGFLIRRIAANLISNALKYSPPACKVIVTLECSADEISLRVKDYGIGIPEVDQQYLFRPFHRGSNVGEVKGTGLGLVVVQQAVDLLGGSLQVQSRHNHGTVVTITFPIAYAAPQRNIQNIQNPWITRRLDENGFQNQNAS